MTKSEFHHGLRILRTIDSHELGDPEWYAEFRADPYLFFIRSAEEAAAIWRAMLRRGVVRVYRHSKS